MIQKLKNGHRYADNYLTDLTDKRNVYLLGLFWADAYISKTKNSIAYTCNSSDFNLYVKDVFESFGFTKFYNYITNSDKPVTGLHIGNKEIHKFLTKNDYSIKSGASPDKILSKIPE